MTIAFAILFVVVLGFAIFLLIKNKRLEEDVLHTQNEAQASVAEAQKSADQRIAAMHQELQTSVEQAQTLIDQQFAEMQQESERIPVAAYRLRAGALVSEKVFSEESLHERADGWGARRGHEAPPALA